MVEESVSKGKGGLFGSLTKSLKRKTSERSPEAPVLSKKGSHSNILVGVVVPEPPIPHSFYQQLGGRSSASQPIVEDVPVPPSSSPSLASLASRYTSSSHHFEAEHLQLQLTATREELAHLKRQYEDQIARQAAAFERERAMYLARIQDLEGALQMGKGNVGGLWR